MADYVGRWDCDNCGAVVWGIFKHCDKCGSNCTGKFYLPDGEPPSTEAQVLEIVKSGPNWVCEHCSSDNWGFHSFCTECGADRGSSPERKVKTYLEEAVPSSSEEAEQIQPEFSTVEPSYIASSSSGKSGLIYADEPTSDFLSRLKWPKNLDGRKISIAAGIIFCCLAAILIAYFLLKPYEVTAKIDHFEWSRSIHIDEYRTVREEDWQIPPGGRYVSQYQKEHHKVRVFDHYETKTREVPDGTERYQCGTTRQDNANGTFSDVPQYCNRTTYRTETYQEAVYRYDPVYQPWYTYDIDRWLPSRTVPTSGRSRNDPEPYWGYFELKCANLAQIGCERESRREEVYTIVFIWKDNDGETKDHRVTDTRSDWDEYDPQGEYILKLNRLGQLLNDPLQN